MSVESLKRSSIERAQVGDDFGCAIPLHLRANLRCAEVFGADYYQSVEVSTINECPHDACGSSEILSRIEPAHAQGETIRDARLQFLPCSFDCAL